VAIKARTWRMGAKDARRILKYASKACPVVDGVMRSPPPFGGSRQNDTPDKSGSDSQSDGDDVGGAGAMDTEPDKTPSASDGGDSTSLESSDEGAPFALMPTAEGAGRGVPSREDAVDLSPASATGVNVAGGASGRSRRAALAVASWRRPCRAVQMFCARFPARCPTLRGVSMRNRRRSASLRPQGRLRRG